MTEENIDQFVHRYIVREILEGRSHGLDASTPLLEWGILNSMELTRLVRALEEEYAVKMPSDAMRPTNFRDIASIRNLVLSVTG